MANLPVGHRERFDAFRSPGSTIRAIRQRLVNLMVRCMINLADAMRDPHRTPQSMMEDFPYGLEGRGPIIGFEEMAEYAMLVEEGSPILGAEAVAEAQEFDQLERMLGHLLWLSYAIPDVTGEAAERVRFLSQVSDRRLHQGITLDATILVHEFFASLLRDAVRTGRGTPGMAELQQEVGVELVVQPDSEHLPPVVCFDLVVPAPAAANGEGEDGSESLDSADDSLGSAADGGKEGDDDDDDTLSWGD